MNGSGWVVVLNGDHKVYTIFTLLHAGIVLLRKAWLRTLRHTQKHLRTALYQPTLDQVPTP